MKPKLTPAQFKLLKEFGKGRKLGHRHYEWTDEPFKATGIRRGSIEKLWVLHFIDLDDGDYWHRCFVITNAGMKYLDEQP